MISSRFSGSEFQAWYKSLEPTLETNLSSFCSMLTDALQNEFDAPFLERIVVRPGRIKKPNRVWEKVRDKGYKIEKLTDIPRFVKDLIGTRIICTNISDLEKIRDFLFGLPIVEWGDTATATLSVLADSKKDYVKDVKKSGYRSVHATLAHRFPNFSGHQFATCEVQARTILQDAWGELTHEDTYRPGAPVPTLVTTISRQMSDLLATLDDMAQTLRDELDQFEAPEVDQDAESIPKQDDGSASGSDSVVNADEFVRQQAVNQLEKLIDQLNVPTAIATVAWRLMKSLGTSFDATWFGFGSFKKLLQHAVPDIEMEARPPGLVFPRNYEKLNSTQEPGIETPEGVPEIAGKLKRFDRSLPLLNHDDMEQVYRHLHDAMRSISISVDPSIYYVNLVTKRARDLMVESDIAVVPRSAFDYVMKALLFSGALTQSPTSEEIGIRYCDSTISRVESLFGDVSSEDEISIRQWLLPSKQ